VIERAVFDRDEAAERLGGRTERSEWQQRNQPEPQPRGRKFYPWGFHDSFSICTALRTTHRVVVHSLINLAKWSRAENEGPVFFAFLRFVCPFARPNRSTGITKHTKPERLPGIRIKAHASRTDGLPSARFRSHVSFRVFRGPHGLNDSESGPAKDAKVTKANLPSPLRGTQGFRVFRAPARQFLFRCPRPRGRLTA